MLAMALRRTRTASFGSGHKSPVRAATEGWLVLPRMPPMQVERRFNRKYQGPARLVRLHPACPENLPLRSHPQ